MDIRAQVSMVFHLDKCIGCHTCSIACKNIWTDRKGTEYMYWNNVETKPGTGYPTRWEDQNHYKGGWVVDGKREKRLRLPCKASGERWGTSSITPICLSSTTISSPGPMITRTCSPRP
jgi:nitrate reductase beta subunit